MRMGVTGHRPKRLPGGYDIQHESNLAIRRWLVWKLQELKPDEGCTGMALGVDQFFAAACLIAGVPFEAFLPCREQESRWPKKSREAYKAILAYTKGVSYTHPGPYPGQWCMLQRNQDMVDWLTGQFGVLLAVWDGVDRGGTWDCVHRARQAELKIIRFNPVTGEEAVEDPFDLEGP